MPLLALSNSTGTISWGNAPSWVAAVGTVLALIFMAGTLRQTNHTLNLQLADFSSRSEDKRRAQAEKVTALTDLTRADDGTQTDIYEAIVSNRSDDMVFDVLVSLPEGQLRDTGPEIVARYDRCPPGEIPKAMECWPRRNPGVDFPRLDITFTDIQGVRWHRGVDQILEEVH